MSNDIVKIQPHHFVHILDQNTNIVLLELGPQCRVLKTHERQQGGPFPCIVIPPGHYCMVKDPCTKYEHGKPAEYKHGEVEVRLHRVPFPLYPGESLVGARDFGYKSATYKPAVLQLPVIKTNEAMVLEAENDFTDDSGVQRIAGEKWQIEGPCTYIPNGNVKAGNLKKAKTIGINESLRVTAMRDFTDRNGVKRVTGEEWIIRQAGAYLTDTFEEVVGIEQPVILKQNVAAHLCATQTITDHFGNLRQAGERWMVTCEETDTLHPMIGVELERVVSRTVLKQNQFCKVTNCVDAEGRPQIGRIDLRCGPTSFFLHPEEEMRHGIENARVLQDDESVVLQAAEAFIDKTGPKAVNRKAGERWMVAGPMVYIPPVEVNVVHQRKAIALAQNEGIYIRNVQTGQVRAVMGPQAYLPNEFEEVWEKVLTPLVEDMLRQGGGTGSEDIRKIAYFDQSIDPAILRGRDKTRVVTYRCPHNTACQILNHLTKTARVVYGPDLVVLGPHEDFNVLSLSAGKPKKADALKSLALMLGPDFITDIIEVETLDHARLRVKLAFNNHFQYDKKDPESGKKIFSVPDFIGFSSRQIGSRVRGAVAQISFDEFHRHSSQAIQAAVFGLDENGQVKDKLVFDANNMVVTGVDIQSIEPVDVKMRDSLMKSIQMAIEISTMAIEQGAHNDAIRLEQKAKGELERAKLSNEMEQEKERAKLLELQAATAAVESTGQAVAEAQAKREAMVIECESHIVGATLEAEAKKIDHECQLEIKKSAQVLELEYMVAKNLEEIHKEQELTNIEISRFHDQVTVLGKDTIRAIATAGPDMQVSMLAGLGIESTLITDGKSPINLFNTANGLVPMMKQ